MNTISKLDKNIGLSTGLDNLNNITLGFKKQELNIIGARVGFGKTSLALKSVVANLEDNNGVLYFSLDLTKKQLKTKIISMESKLPLKDLQKGIVSDKEKLDNATRTIENKKLFIDDTKYPTLEYIINKSRDTMDNNIKLIVVDYIQLIKNDNQNIARELKKLAIELNLTIVALTQLNKNIDDRANTMPRLNDIEDKHIEIEANLIILIYIDDFYKEYREEEKVMGAHMRGENYKSSFLDRLVVEVNIAIVKNTNHSLLSRLNIEFHKDIAMFAEID